MAEDIRVVILIVGEMNTAENLATQQSIVRREKKVCAEETVDGIEGMQPGGDTMKGGGTDAGAGAEKTIAGEAGIKTKRGEAETGMREEEASPGKGETSTFFYRERKSGEQYLKEVQLYVVAAMPPPPRGGDTMRVEDDHLEAAAHAAADLEQYFPEEDTVRVNNLL